VVASPRSPCLSIGVTASRPSSGVAVSGWAKAGVDRDRHAALRAARDDELGGVVASPRSPRIPIGVTASRPSAGVAVSGWAKAVADRDRHAALRAARDDEVGLWPRARDRPASPSASLRAGHRPAWQSRAGRRLSLIEIATRPCGPLAMTRLKVWPRARGRPAFPSASLRAGHRPAWQSRAGRRLSLIEIATGRVAALAMTRLGVWSRNRDRHAYRSASLRAGHRPAWQSRAGRRLSLIEIATRPCGPLAMTRLNCGREPEIATRPYGPLAMTRLGCGREPEIAAGRDAALAKTPRPLQIAQRTDLKAP
jgi:hypothetical protein